MQTSTIQANLPNYKEQYADEFQGMAANIDSQFNSLYAASTQISGSCGISFITPPYGTIGNNGALVLSSALTNTYRNAFIYSMAGNLWSSLNGNGIPNPAGWYFCQMTNPTTLQVFQNTYSGSGFPSIPTNPIPLVNATAPSGNFFNSPATGWYLANVCIPIIGGSLGPNGSIFIKRCVTNKVDSTSKTIYVLYGGNPFISSGLTSGVQYWDEPMIWNKGNQNINMSTFADTIGSGGNDFTLGLIDTTQTQALTFASLLPAATGTSAVEWVVHEYMYAATNYGA